jgi:hypothetical protein
MLSLKEKLMKTNYLNNKDILKEIHKSKTTYCSYLDRADADYDIILPDVKKINKTNIMQGRKNRAERLAKLAHEAAVAESGVKRKLDEFEVKLKDVRDTDVVFRIMTWEHIPEDLSKRKKAVVEEEVVVSEYDDPAEIAVIKYTKCNFPPFQHYKLNDVGEPVCVGKSHW